MKSSLKRTVHRAGADAGAGVVFAWLLSNAPAWTSVDVPDVVVGAARQVTVRRAGDSHFFRLVKH
jgi:hypothetical protein